MLKEAFVIFTMFTLVACAGTSIKPDEYRTVATGTADDMPSQTQLSATKTKIVLFDTKDKAKNASFPRMAAAMNGAIEHQIISAGAEIVDRSLASRLGKEIDLFEMNGQGTYDGPAIAHFALKPSIHKAVVTSKFNRATSWKDKEGKIHHSPANCAYNSSMEGTLNLYEIPSLRLVKAINLSGGSSMKDEQYRGEHCPIAANNAEALLATASENAIRQSRLELQNEITPSAYVSERKKKGDEGEGEGIIVTTLGTELGAKQGENINVFRVENSVNSLTGKKSTRKYKIAEGKISSQIGADYSWVIIKEGFEGIRIGNQLKIIHKCGLGDITNPNCIKKMFNR